MPRRRFAVALLAPPVEAAEVDVLRRAVGVPEPFHVPPHVTLIPPINVADGDVGSTYAVVRRAAGAAQPLRLDVGPATSFRPETPTLHLDVSGPDMDAVRALRGDLRSGPLDRPDVWPFHPHATICEHAELSVIDAGLVAMAGYRRSWDVASVHLLEQRRGDPAHGDHGRAPWVPVHEEPLGPVGVVGRGGVEVALRTVSMVEAPVAALLGQEPTVSPTRPGPLPVVVVAESARDRDVLLGAMAGVVPSGGEIAQVDRLVVSAEHRGLGVAGHLFRAWCSAAADRGAHLVLASSSADEDAGRFLAHLGFDRTGDRWIRPI